MRKLYVVTGAKGAGKSTALVTKVPPVQAEMDRLCVIDTEDSFSDILAELKRNKLEIGCYIRMAERIPITTDMLNLIAQGKPPWVSADQQSQWLEYYEYFIKRLNKEMTPGRFKYLIIDTIEPIEAAMSEAVEKGKRQFGWSGARSYGKKEIEGVRPLYDGLLEAFNRRGVEEILISAHLKQPWEDDKPVPGAVKPGGRLKVLSQLSVGMFWLVQGDNADGAPAALVMKARMGHMGIENGQWKNTSYLPERIPHFTWADIARYKEHPADLMNPAPGEKATEEEKQMLSEVLSDAQMRLMVAMRESSAIPAPVLNTPVDIAGELSNIAATTNTEYTIKSTESTSVGSPSNGDPDKLAKKEAAKVLQQRGWDLVKIARELKTPPPIVNVWLEE